MTGPMINSSLDAAPVTGHVVGGWHGVFRQLVADRMGRAGLLMVAAVVLVAVAGPLLAPYTLPPGKRQRVTAAPLQQIVGTLIGIRREMLPKA